jgi:hypothetical protein
MKKSELKQIIKEEILKVLNEGKQVGTLYHFTSLDGSKGILETNTIVSDEYDFISLTRDKNYYKIADQIEGGLIRLTIDGDKLSNNYKIYPYDEGERKKTYRGSYFESEERVKGNIKNAKNYIVKIDVILDFYDYGDPELLYYKPQEITNIFSIYQSSGIPFDILLKNNKVDLKTWLKINRDFIAANF